ncbi:MAG: site-specific integrase [Alphaproteobacteria bacterium]|nr:site-specific integrase [Alphaproteobacteria bacterium]
MKGHIRERGPNRFAIVLDIRDPSTGKRKRKWHSFRGTKREAQIECARLISTMNGGTYLEPDKTTLAAYLERWLEHIKPNVATLTHERYCDLARKNIVPLLGATILSKLQMVQVSAAYAKALKSGRRNGKGGLSPRTVHHMHRVLKQALAQAMRWNLIVRNPADIQKKDRPKIDKKPVATIDPATTMQTIEAARQSRLLVPLLLGSMGGLRRGEIAAIRWKSLDLDRAQAAVVASIEQTKAGCREKETKGSKCRTIALPSILIDELKAWRVQQAQELLRLGIRPDGETRVVTWPDGSSLQPRSLTHAIAAFMKGQGQAVRLHGLRHSHASHLLAENVHPKVVQERLGHSSIAITMDIYSHVMPNMQTDAAAKVDAALRSAKQSA